MQKQHQTLRIVIIVICLVILASGGFKAITFGTVGEGYTTGYEGAKAQIYGIDWNYKTQHGKTSFPLKGTTFHFDADEKDKPRTGACNLEGEMTSVFLPERSRPANWIDQSWWDTAIDYINNPIEHYEWEIEEGDTTILYAMDEYNLKWYFSISAEWDKLDVAVNFDREYMDQRYSNTQIWFEFNLKPIWYFEGAETSYFSIAKIRLSNIALGGKLGDEGKETDASSKCRVTPMSKGSILPIYYNPYGVANDRAEKESYVFKGKKLNPDLFTDKVYAYFTLADFGTEVWSVLFGSKWKGDVVTVGFDFHVFVVGEWKVQDIQEIPEEYGRTSKTGMTSGASFMEQLARILAGPEFKLWFILGMIAIIVLVLAIFAPWVLFSIVGLYRYSKKK